MATKRIDGKTYLLVSTERLKSDARHYKERLKAHGHSVRIIKTKDGYQVWDRPAKTR